MDAVEANDKIVADLDSLRLGCGLRLFEVLDAVDQIFPSVNIRFMNDGSESAIASHQLAGVQVKDQRIASWRLCAERRISQAERKKSGEASQRPADCKGSMAGPTA